MPFIPGIVDEASSHIGRLAQVVRRGRQQGTLGPSWDVASFESIADQLDSSDEAIASRTKAEMDKMKKLSRPYLVSAGIEGGIR